VKRFKLLLFISTCLLVSSTSWGHQYFFAFVEIEYNEFGQKLEGTLVATSHDLESTLMMDYGLKTKLEKLTPSSEEANILENYLNKFLLLQYGCSLDSNAVDAYCSAKWELESFQIFTNGSIELYFSSPVKQIHQEIRVACRFLMDVFPEQQNKVSILYRGKEETLSFTKYHYQQSFALKP
jgi:hypothetical protein